MIVKNLTICQGCISVFGEGVDRRPEVVKGMTQDGGANGKEVIEPMSTPAHAGTSESGLKLFSARFDDAGADEKAVFA